MFSVKLKILLCAIFCFQNYVLCFYYQSEQKSMPTVHRVFFCNIRSMYCINKINKSTDLIMGIDVVLIVLIWYVVPEDCFQSVPFRSSLKHDLTCFYRLVTMINCLILSVGFLNLYSGHKGDM